MNKRAKTGMFMNTIIYTVLVAIFFSIFLVFIMGQMDGAAIWEDYYSKEIVKIINNAEPGDTIVLDVHEATVMAKDHGVMAVDIFGFNRELREVCVGLSYGRETCFPYFNDVVILEPKIEYGKGKIAHNTLHFKINESSYDFVSNEDGGEDVE